MNIYEQRKGWVWGFFFYREVWGKYSNFQMCMNPVNLFLSQCTSKGRELIPEAEFPDDLLHHRPASH